MRVHHAIAVAAFVATLAAAGVARAADFGAAGPESVALSDLAANAGGAVGGKLVVPGGAGPYPLIVATHGFSGSADNQTGWARHFASWGFVVVVPSLPNPFSPDAQVNAGVIKALVKLYADPATVSPARGKVDARRVGLEGFSAGGLATVIAAKEIAPLATVLLDPVDKDDGGKSALPSLCGPLLSIFTEPSGCNANGNWVPFRGTAKGPAVHFKVAGANHCDGENTSRALCSFAGCGGVADTGRQTVIARHVTAFLLANLKRDAEAASSLGEARLRADAALTDVAVASAPSCVAPPGGASDAGTAAPGDASAGGASGTSSGAPAPPAGGAGAPVAGDDDRGASAPAADPDDAGAPAASGCAAASRAPRMFGGLALAALAASAIARRRRRAAR